MKKIIIGIITLVIAITGMTYTAMAANTIEEICGKDDYKDSTFCRDACLTNPNYEHCKQATEDVNNLVRNTLNIFFSAIGILALAMIVWSGVRMTIFQDNDTKNWAKARSILLYSVIGLIVAALALVVVNLATNIASDLQDPNKQTQNVTDPADQDNAPPKQ